MNANDTEATGMNPETVTNDLTQLSSREQLSALMDGALPADQTRFLLRRLQHDDSLAECWERWRLTGEVMRGLAPAQRLPADFAARVGASLRGDAPAMTIAARARTPGWMRWGGSAAVAASLAVVALMARQPVGELQAPAASMQVASANTPASGSPAAPASEPVPTSVAQLPQGGGSAAQALAVASVAAAAGKPARNRDRNSVRSIANSPMQTASTRPGIVATTAMTVGNAMLDEVPAMPQPDIVTRPWPRSVLPQYASGALVVGFGTQAQGASAYEPFKTQAAIGSLPVLATAAEGDGATREAPNANVDPQRDVQAKP